MAALITDAQPAAPADAPMQQAAAGSAPALPDHACSKCSAPMVAGQDWCLSCGAGAPGGLTGSGLRAGAAVIVAALVLAAGAAAAAVAAIGKHNSASVPKTQVALVTAGASTTPATAPSTTTTTTPPGTIGAQTTPVPSLTTTAKPPKIPLTAVTPTPAKTSTAPAVEKVAPQAEQTKTTPAKAAPPAEAKAPATGGIELDTNAATTYNPYNYAEEGFGDPSESIDGDTSTVWFTAVQPKLAPKVNTGLLLNLGSAPQRIGDLFLITSTPGFTVQVYGTTATTAPDTITSPEWVSLSDPRALKKKHTLIKLQKPGEAFNQIVLWISKVPSSMVGTEEKPGHVDINEVELFSPAAS